VTPDGRLAVSASGDGTLKVWDLATGSEMRSLAGHTDPVKGVAVSENGKLAISASEDWTLKVWEVASGCELRSRVTRNLTPEECRKSLHRDDVPPIP
jgi:WD40 repeat protein